jgi:hypothetical protein
VEVEGVTVLIVQVHWEVHQGAVKVTEARCQTLGVQTYFHKDVKEVIRVMDFNIEVVEVEVLVKPV